MSQFVRCAILSAVALASLPATAIAAPYASGAGIGVPSDGGVVQRIFDDHGWRKRIHACCHGKNAAPSAGGLGAGVAPRLGGDSSGSSAYGSHDWRGAYGGDDPVYGQERLAPSRTFQRDSLGGGYFGDSRPLDDGE
jgi:hypothetical protein